MNDDKLRKLIRMTDLPEPSALFTDDVMKMIVQEDQLKMNPVLKAALQGELLVRPSNLFTNGVMKVVQPGFSTNQKPLFRKKLVLIFLGCMGIIVAGSVVFLRLQVRVSALDGFFGYARVSFPSLTEGIAKSASPVLPYLVPVSLLLVIDYFFRTRRRLPNIERE